MDIVFPILVFLVLLVSAWAGWFAQDKLHERHTSRETFDSIRLLMGMLLTFSALVLGLLTSDAKNRFDGYDKELSLLSAKFIDLDHRLRLFGAEGAPIRKELRTYLAAAIADSWPAEPRPTGIYPTFPPRSGLERTPLGELLSRADQQILQLPAEDNFHKQAVRGMRDLSSAIVQTRWQLITSTGSDISWPFLFILASWLAIIFAIFGLTSPRNGLVYVAVAMSALSITSPLFLIMDYSDAMNGLLQLSSAPLRTALTHMDAP